MHTKMIRHTAGVVFLVACAGLAIITRVAGFTLPSMIFGVLSIIAGIIEAGSIMRPDSWGQFGWYFLKFVHKSLQENNNANITYETSGEFTVSQKLMQDFLALSELKQQDLSI